MVDEKVIEEEQDIKKLLKSEIIENKHIYEKLLEIERAIRGKDRLKFKHVEEWKEYVWNDCEFRTTIEKDNIIEHDCEKTKTACHFIGCPLNIK